MKKVRENSRKIFSKYLRLTGFVFLIFSLTISCKKKNAEEKPDNKPVSSKDNILNSNAYLVDTVAVTNIKDASLVVLKNTTFRPKVGDILLVMPSSSNPDGIMRKVLTIAESGNQITCTTEQSNLNDAFAQLNVSTNYQDTFSAVKTFGIGSKLSVKFKDDNTIANGIRLSGEIFFNIPTVKFEYVKKKGELTPEKVLIQVGFDTDGSTLEITNTDNSNYQVGQKVLTSFDLPVIRIPIPIATPLGVILFPVPFSEKLKLTSLPLTISAKAKWTTLPKCSAVLGAKYENASWSNISTLSIDASAPSLVKGNFAPTAILSANVVIVTPEYNLYPYKIEALRTFFSIPNSMLLTLQTASPNYSLKYNLTLSGGVKQEFFTGAKPEYSLSSNLIQKTLVEGEWSKTLPIISTTNPNPIAYTTTITGGVIADDGGSTITAKGVCWSTSQNPSLTDNKTTDGTGSGSFTSNINGLLDNTTYYVRAYATNSLGTAYGNQLTFTTKKITLPTLSTTIVSAITQTSATSGATILDDGGGKILGNGVCWSTTHNPTFANNINKTFDALGAGSFTSSITNLTANTTYYVRAYATNSAGTAYGNEVSFKTISQSSSTQTNWSGSYKADGWPSLNFCPSTLHPEWKVPACSAPMTLDLSEKDNIVTGSYTMYEESGSVNGKRLSLNSLELTFLYNRTTTVMTSGSDIGSKMSGHLPGVYNSSGKLAIDAVSFETTRIK